MLRAVRGLLSTGRNLGEERFSPENVTSLLRGVEKEHDSYGFRFRAA